MKYYLANAGRLTLPTHIKCYRVQNRQQYYDISHLYENILKHKLQIIVQTLFLSSHIPELVMMGITWSTNIPKIIRRGMDQLITCSPIYCTEDNGENWLHLRHTLDRIYLASILYVQYAMLCESDFTLWVQRVLSWSVPSVCPLVHPTFHLATLNDVKAVQATIFHVHIW